MLRSKFRRKHENNISRNKNEKKEKKRKGWGIARRLRDGNEGGVKSFFELIPITRSNPSKVSIKVWILALILYYYKYYISIKPKKFLI